MPIVVFLHGGAYVRGSRSVNTEVYGNVRPPAGDEGGRLPC